MRVKMLAAVVVVAGVAALTGAELRGQEPRQARRAGFAGLANDIGLSAEQQDSIRRIHTDARKAGIRRNADLRIARMELDELMGAATLDEAKIAARVKAIGDLQAAAFKERTESRLAVRRLVTAEQYQKMQQAMRGAMREQRSRGPRPANRGIGGPEGGPGGPGDGEDLAEVDPS